MNNLLKIAIESALSKNWTKAVEANNEILNLSPDNLDALNRLAYAYIQLGDLDRAKKYYKKVLSLDHYNYLAHKNLDKMSSYSNKPPIKINSDQKQSKVKNVCLYIEEPGKTKTVSLINTAPPTVLSEMHIGDPVYLYPKKHTIEIRNGDKVYIGALPDDLSFRLIRFIKAGNLYDVYIKNLQKKCVSVFINEIKRGKRFASQPTFLTNIASYNSSTPKDIKKIISKDETVDDDSQEECEE
jgi:tetratricopeptide (TPR) repeat protein